MPTATLRVGVKDRFDLNADGGRQALQFAGTFRITPTIPAGEEIGAVAGADGNWGVRIFDLDGCVGAGETAEEAIAGATEALRDVISYKRSGNHPVPAASSVAHVLASGEVQAGESTVLIPLVVDAGRSVRANLTLDAGLLEAVDQAAATAGLTRSAYFASAARDKLMMV